MKTYNFDCVENTLDHVEISTVNKLIRKPFKYTIQTTVKQKALQTLQNLSS